MKNDFALEAWLRPPVEFWSAGAAGIVAVLSVAAPWALLMPPLMGWIACALLSAFAVRRFRQGLFIVRYQRGMKRLPMFMIKAEEIPVSNRRYYLGRGFSWQQVHTQRLRDTRNPDVQRFVQPGALYQAARRIEDAAERNRMLAGLAALTSKKAWWNPVEPLPPVGGNPRLHAVEPNEKDVFMELGERVGHTVIYGATRVGKSRFLEIGVTQDIHRGDVTIVIDPKGDAGIMKRCYAEAARAGRLDAFYLFHLGFPEISARYNAIGDFTRITQVATRLTNPLPSSGASAAFREFSWRFTNVIARAIVALGRKPDYRQILRSVDNIEPLFLEYANHWLAQSAPAGYEEELASLMKAGKGSSKALEARSAETVAMLRYIAKANLRDPVIDGLCSIVNQDPAHFAKLVASLGPLLEKLTTGAVGELLSPDYFDVSDSRPIFDWMKVIRQGGIVYVGLDALTDSTVAAAVGNSMFADLVAVGGEIYKTGMQTRVALHLDEFSDLAGEEFVPMANKIGGAGFQLNIYTQTSADIEARMGSKAKAEQVIGNMNTMIMFRVKNMQTAEQLTDGLPEVDINALTMVSGVTDSAGDKDGVHFTSSNEDRVATQTVPLVSPAELMSLPKGQAFALLEGGHLWKVRMPLCDTAGDKHLPESILDLAGRMERRYRSSEQWWQGPEQAPRVRMPGLDVDEPAAAAPSDAAASSPAAAAGGALQTRQVAA